MFYQTKIGKQQSGRQEVDDQQAQKVTESNVLATSRQELEEHMSTV